MARSTMTSAPPAANFASHRVADQSEAVAFLRSGAAFGGVEPVIIETQGAMVFLAGDVALKLKKAVRFPFLDWSTAERRGAACAAEIAVNRPFAPALYHEILPICRGAGGGLTLGGGGEPVDYVVRMTRFDETKTLDRLAASGALNGPLLDQIALAVKRMHDEAPQRPFDIFAKMLAATLDENAIAFAEAPSLFPPARADALGRRLRDMLLRQNGALQRRGELGLVRRCHGDLHLRNIALVAGVPQPFDAIEFDESIPTGDVLYDLAFLLMDLWERGHKSEANRVFTAYLDATRRGEDLDALVLLPLYLAIRSTIRAKVTAAAAGDSTGARAKTLVAEACGYFDAAEAFAMPAPPRILAIGGLSGTGKTTLARRLAASIGAAPGAVLLRSDVERKALFGRAALERLPQEAYAPEVSAKVFAALAVKAERVLRAGHGVVVDAVFAKPKERAKIERVAIGQSVPFLGLFLEAPLNTRMSRVESRVGDASDAGAEVAAAQEHYDLGAMRWARIDASSDPDMTAESARRVLLGS